MHDVAGTKTVPLHVDAASRQTLPRQRRHAGPTVNAAALEEWS